MPSLSGVWKQVRWSVESRGVLGTATLAARRIVGADPGAREPVWKTHPFDTENGVDTSGRVNGSKLGGGHAHDKYNIAYQGTPPSRLHDAVARWQSLPGARPLAEVAFFDIGCGKGRAVMLASEMGFREAGGVELDPEMARIGEENLKTWRAAGKAKCPVSLHAGDATEVPLPEPPCLFWMYNPFRAPVMRKMLGRLDAHAGEREGEMDILYLIPNESAEFAQFPRFRRIWEGTAVMSAEDSQWEDSDMEDKAEIWRR